jgi:hypothetical protein
MAKIDRLKFLTARVPRKVHKSIGFFVVLLYMPENQKKKIQHVNYIDNAFI